MPTYITRSNTNYTVNNVDLASNGFVTREYIIDVYPSLAAQFKQAGLWTWGRNNNGQLGDGTVVDRSSPVQTIAGGSNWQFVSSGKYNMSAIKTDGTLWVWGLNTDGQLGDTTRTHRSSPVQTIAGGTTWKQVSSGFATTSAIKTDGTLWIWGHNSYGQIGDTTRTARSSPVQTIAGGTNWKQVSSDGSSFNVAAVKTDGTLWLWGSNTSGQLGDTTRTHRSSPIQTIAGGTTWIQVSLGAASVATIKTDGTLWTWGTNSTGILGDGTVTSRSSPVQTIAGDTTWKEVNNGGTNNIAIKTDGTLWVWGWNDQGQLNDGTLIHRSSPVQTVAGGTNWKKAVIGNKRYVMALKTDGTLWTWGQNDFGQLGDDTKTKRSSPIQTIAGGTNWKFVSNDVVSAAIRDDSMDPI